MTNFQKYPDNKPQSCSDQKKKRMICSISVIKNSLEILKLKYGNYFDWYIRNDFKRMERALDKLSNEILEDSDNHNRNNLLKV